MKKYLSLSLIAVIGLGTTLFAAGAFAAKPESELDKFSYAIGFQIAQGMKRDGLEVNTDMMAQAVRDVLDNKPLQMEMVDMRSAMVAMQQQMQAKQEAKAGAALAAGKAFQDANKAKKGVTTLPSGLQYRVIKAGSGKQPSATDSITAHYHGTLINGEVFDSSYDRGQPATFNVNQVIKGWQEVLPLMHEGDKWQVVIPAEMAYGSNGAGNDIGPNETLVFDIELISVN